MNINRVEKAAELFAQKNNCAQSVLMAFCESYGLDSTMATKLASGLGGGLGRKGEICGAANGACLVLGLETGSREDIPENEKKKYVYDRIQEFLDAFRQQCGAVTCRDLIGCDISTEAGRADGCQ